MVENFNLFRKVEEETGSESLEDQKEKLEIAIEGAYKAAKEGRGSSDLDSNIKNTLEDFLESLEKERGKQVELKYKKMQESNE
ncbi:MAG: hypothetical protein PHI88_00440 [Candidatus Pacebacteria bacterium]|nr:hypothetical protein [Candidatus Paceibacterota bacterium]